LILVKTAELHEKTLQIAEEKSKKMVYFFQSAWYNSIDLNRPHSLCDSPTPDSVCGDTKKQKEYYP